MRQVCYICGILYGIKKPYENDEETHGLCEECFPVVMANIERKMEKVKGDITHESD
jgi:hypothetical protein